MLLVSAFPLLLFLVQQPPSCADVASCRAAAVEAQGRKDYEAFHDLAWMAYRKGRADDPELMLLLARAQSLSGRPGDAIVMLERLAARGVTTDAATSEDFARVRELDRGKGLASAPAASVTAPVAPAPEPTRISPLPVPTPSIATPPFRPAPVPAAPKRDAGTPLKFTTVLTPSALAYDAVSRRFIIADRAARRIAVIDENTGQVATLVGAQAALGDIGGIAIDPQQGDLWVVSSSAGGTLLHRMQLISGRVLSTTTLAGPEQGVVALAFARNHGLVVSDGSGTIWHVRAGGQSEKLAALEYVPRALATDGEGRLYVAAGGPRLARFALGSSLRKIDVLELGPGVPTDAPFVVIGSRLHVIVASDGGYEIRSVSLPKR